MTVAPLFGSCRLNISLVLMLGGSAAILMTSTLSFAIVCINQNNIYNDSIDSNSTNCTYDEELEQQSCIPLVQNIELPLRVDVHVTTSNILLKGCGLSEILIPDFLIPRWSYLQYLLHEIVIVTQHWSWHFIPTGQGSILEQKYTGPASGWNFLWRGYSSNSRRLPFRQIRLLQTSNAGW